MYLGVDEKEVGAPEKLPEHTFEVGHDRRRSYLITAENEEDKQTWVETFKTCCRKANGKVYRISCLKCTWRLFQGVVKLKVGCNKELF